MSLAFSHTTLERPAVVLPLALVLLAAAAGVMWSNFAAHPARAPAPAMIHPRPVAIAILTANDAIARGQLLSAADLVVKMMDPDKAPAALHQTNDAVGHVALSAIAAGQAVTAHDLSPQAQTGIAALVPEGYRAYAIPVAEADIAGGFLQAGDRADHYVTLPGSLFAASVGKDDDRSKAQPLLQNVLVLAVGAKLHPDGAINNAVRTATLSLSAADLARVALAARLGTITFALRNPVDDAQAGETGLGLSGLIGAPAPSSRTVHVAPGIPMLAGRDRASLQLP
jgi:pilus assembly protein CpaB